MPGKDAQNPRDPRPTSAGVQADVDASAGSCLSGTTLGSSASRFLVISALGLAINETAYAWLLGWSGHRYDVVLAAVLVCVAVITYGLSQHWAFRGKTRH